jgi:hypothetical protein
MYSAARFDSGFVSLFFFAVLVLADAYVKHDLPSHLLPSFLYQCCTVRFSGKEKKRELEKPLTPQQRWNAVEQV